LREKEIKMDLGKLKKINSDIFLTFPELETPRLFLKQLNLDHAQQVFAMRKSKMVNRFIARPEMESEENAATLVQQCAESFNEKRGIAWAGILKTNGEMIGTCGFNHIDYPNLRAEIGGEMSTAYWGKHLAVEAVAAIVEFGLEILQLHSIEAKVMPENRGAISLLETLGFLKEAHFHDRVYFDNQFSDMAVYTKFKN